ncbi:unnamed protein product [Rhizophagus irregularis]|nr:unnamed protein product [Rhizophagus irregularis]
MEKTKIRNSEEQRKTKIRLVSQVDSDKQKKPKILLWVSKRSRFWKAVGSLAFTAEKDELQHFLFMRHNTSTFSKIYGTEKLPGQMINPSCFKVIIPLVLRRFLCEWYSILYEKEQNEILGFMDLVIDQYARLQIASNDDSVDIYPGDVQYYFEHTLRLPEGLRKHLLAYVKWYKSAPSSDIRFKHRFIEPEISNT